MKKKGLIISTVVMVVVLIASLTTATYAWFTAASKTEVTAIPFSVTSDSDLTIGVSKTNKINDAAGGTIGQNLFVSGSGMSYDIAQDAWTGTEGLGFEVDTGLDLSDMKKAVFTGTAYVAGNADSGTIDETLKPEGTWVKASGNGTEVTKTEITTATANGNEESGTKGDYLNVCFGVASAKQNVTKVYCVIGVNPTAGNTTLGMNAAISFVYKIDDGEWSGIQQIYTQTEKFDYNASTPVNTVTVPAKLPDITWNPGAQTYTIPIFGNGTDIVAQGEIHQIHIKLFINGKDADCNNAAANVSSSITINFTADKKTSA